MKNKIGSLVKVEWYDAFSDTWDDEKIDYTRNCLLNREALCINTTYGKLFRYEKEVTIILTEESTSTKQEVTVIPTEWIKKVTILK